MGLENLSKHLSNLFFEIAKIDNEIIETPNIAVSELIKKRLRRVELGQTSEFIQYLISVTQEKENKKEEGSKIITM